MKISVLPKPVKVQIQLPVAREEGKFNDPAFAKNKTLPIHRWVPWIAGFSSDFVRDVFQKNCGKKKCTVLDPFVGVGTTLVEAMLMGHDSIGFEINPYAALAARIKAEASSIDHTQALRAIEKLQSFYQNAMSSDNKPKSAPPLGFKTRGIFYSPAVLKKVLTIQDFIQSERQNLTTDLLYLAFASTMIQYSNYSYEPSLGRRSSAGKQDIEDFPVIETIISKLSMILEDIVWLEENKSKRKTKSKVINASFFKYKKYLKPDSIDILITSPPYLNNYHYIRNTRPQLYWLGFASKPTDLKSLEENNFGKYWQTVRENKCVKLNFVLPSSKLGDQLEKLRNISPEKGIYGGNGWANYAASYFNDCYRFAQGIHYSLRKGGKAFVVIGNSILQGDLIPTDHYFAEIAQKVGLRFCGIDVPRPTRIGNSIIQSRVKNPHKDHQLYEAIIELEKI